MRYGILGTTQAFSDDGSPLAVGGVRLRALLAALALHPGRVRGADALIDDVWDGEPPADATGALQALVGRLRRALGHETVASEAGGYRLCAEPDDVDLHRFERLAGEGERALADGDAEKAAVLLDDALALWRGRPLADLPGGAFHAVRHEARHLAARRARLAASVALGQAARSLPELAELSEAHPLDEPLQALHLRALRDSGRPAEALAAYGRVRAVIAGRLGTEPGPELRALHAELLNPEPAGAPAGPGRDTAAPSAPRPGADAPRDTGAEPAAGPTAARAGGADTAAAQAPASSAAPAAAPPRGNLRARLTSFVGREDDLARIRADLAGHRLVTLLGPGGAGKTRLSQEAAESAATAGGHWPDGVWLAELAPVDDPQNVPEAVLTALGARETVVRATAAEGLRAAGDVAGADPLTRLAEHCAPRRMLLVLDNCEHVIDAAARLAETLLAGCPGVTVLATSREPLAVPGELVRPVEPLPDPVALRLLADRGAAARPGFRVDDDPEACAEICRRLDGLPLAIELAAARLRLLTPRGLADRLDDRFRLLTSGSRTVLPRQQTLRAVVDWSWDLLDASERAVLRRLSVFSGGCDLAAAEDVCADGADGAGDVGSWDVAALLGSLVDKSLVVAAPAGDGQMRYRLLETVGEYAGEQLDAAGERAAVERRHLVAYRELARTADPLLRGPEQRVWLDRLELEHDNLRSALRRAVAAGDEQEVLCLVLSLNWFWQLRDHVPDGRAWSKAAAALGPDPFAEPVVPAPPLLGACTDTPPPMTPEVLEEARRQVRLVMLSHLESDMRMVESPEMQRMLHGIVTAYGDGQPQNCRVPGMMWFYARMLTAALDELHRAVDMAVERCRRLGYTWELANALQLRAKLLNDSLDRADQGILDADESLEIFRRLGDSWGVAEALSGRAEAREKRGQFASAAEDYREAIERVRELGSNGQVPLLRSRLVEVLQESGEIDLAEAERMLREALADAERLPPDAAIFPRLQLGVCLGRSGDLRQAREIFEGLLDDFAGRAIALFDGLMNGLGAWVDVLEGRPQEALPKIRVALEMGRHPVSLMVAPQMVAAQLLQGAHAYAVLSCDGAGDGRGAEHARTAAVLLGAYAALRPAGFHASTLEREVREQAETRARALLGRGDFEQACAEGARLSLVEASALV
ncbi:AfsR family transcriptional regulator [Streptomyces cinnamoneus]|uniref:AfsR family transcriptional regulator n=1 Tax=Streptomyces cinnamoneus TaxID=53446 RepID=A0A2G1XGF4_STRCJ|nr:BTAD domain-containing putative transcriptional regulator [Streptomyces cinnamoneus]PHQ50281.1 AfsR family transcriptional regulator [Streptomyces cinnamoneus]PPT12933.1 AfsR family transcriptional regulator [Streptomyces cinnamoneus]